MPVKPDDLIPPDSELAVLLAQWSEDTDTRTWNIANLTNELVEELEGGVSRKDIYRAVAARCKGRKVNTIRRWAEVAWDFSPEIQDRYSQLLSFEHFKVSRRLFHDGLTPDIEYGLKWCVEGNDDKLSAGRFHTVGDLLRQFVPEYRNPNPKQTWLGVREKLYDQWILIDNDTDRERLIRAWKEIDFVLDKKDKI